MKVLICSIMLLMSMSVLADSTSDRLDELERNERFRQQEEHDRKRVELMEESNRRFMETAPNF